MGSRLRRTRMTTGPPQLRAWAGCANFAQATGSARSQRPPAPFFRPTRRAGWCRRRFLSHALAPRQRISPMLPRGRELEQLWYVGGQSKARFRRQRRELAAQTILLGSRRSGRRPMSQVSRREPTGRRYGMAWARSLRALRRRHRV